jgi:ribonucleoside-diphosphate reductase alpha subunit
MFVIKRSGIKENVQFDKITSRLQKLLYGGLDKTIDPAIITQKICSRMSSGITTTELDNLASQICMGMIIDNPDFGILGARIVISNHQKNTDDDFLSVVTELKNNKDIQGNVAPLVSDELYNIVLNNTEFLQNMIDFERDYLLDYFGFKTLERSYLLKVNEGKVKRIVERPQHLFLRVAIGIHGDDFESVKKTYDNMSLKNYTHATPTLFNAGTPHCQLSSCFLLGTEDSVEGIFETMTDCAKISKWSGGIGLHISNIRANGSYIRKTAGTSDGILPMLKVYNDIARYINQGGGKRNGSFAVYLEPHHADVIPFLEARKNVGPEELRARDLFYALWVSDYFMECIEKNQDWYLMDPDQSFGLNEVYGDEYTLLYKKYVAEGKYMKKIKARELWEHIIASQIEHGMPYISYKDHVNRKSNQKHYGTIKSSNLCDEILQYSDKDETAVCNLGSICLPKILEYPFTDEWRNLSDSNLIPVYEDSSRVLKLYSTSDCDYCKLLKALLKSCGLSYIEIDEFEAETLRLKHNPESKPFETVPQLFSVHDDNFQEGCSEPPNIVYLGGYADNWKILSPRINYNKLYELAYELTVNLNKVIDINFYPTEKTRLSNMKHRPIGLGVQGLADVFMSLKLPFTSDEAREINKEIFETIYFGSMSASVYLAKRDGRYPTYEGSPLSEGKFQYNLWGVKDIDLSGRWKWGELRNDLLKYGSRNSLNIALMPTASTASIFGNVESFEAITSNLYTRNVLSGVFTMINKYLIKDLMDLEIWNQDTKDRLIYNKGSVQNLKALPKFLRDIYKTSFEIDQKLIIKMSAERGVFVCQSQSLNLFFDKPTFKELTACHFYGWKNGLKTGSYYIRTRSALSGQNFGLDPRKEKQLREEKISDVEDEGCLSCGA